MFLVGLWAIRILKGFNIRAIVSEVPLMYGNETVEFVFRFCVRAYVILFVMFVFVGVNKFVTVIVLVEYLA